MKIKFRGVTTDGTTVYGDLIRKKGLRAKEIWQIVSNSAYFYVKPESVAQLVGYDSKGKEIYTGDTLIFDDKEYTVPQYEPPRFYSLSEVKHEGD